MRSISETARLLCRNAVDVIDKADLEARLETAQNERRPLRIKAGFDPSAPDIHLGHTVLLRKLRQFQDLGHKVVFIIGDYTAMIGDPTGQTKTRPVLSKEEVRKNAKTYQAQAFKILDKNPKKIEVVSNSAWLGKLSLQNFLENVATRFTHAQIIQREDFQKRIAENRPISFRELMYPLLQAYDSVMVKADVELGGTDQLFNLLAGRDLQPKFGQNPQVIMTLPLLIGLDGTQKMSKSLGNTVAINDTAKNMYGKIMSIPDALMEAYFNLLTDLPWVATANPMEAKKNLARAIVRNYYGESAAKAEAEEWDRIYSKREAPANPDRVKVEKTPLGLAEALKRAGAVASTSEAFRMIQQGGVSVNGEKVTNPKHVLDPNGEPLVKAGKKKFFKLVVKA